MVSNCKAGIGLLLLVGLWVNGERAESQCTSGFMTLDTLRELGQVTGGNRKNRDQQQRIIPSINFTCDGSITKWIVAAKWENGGGHTYFPELQIWRAGTFSYRKVGSSTLSATSENQSNVYEHVPSSPLPFQEGDFLGIFQPDQDTSRLRVYYIDKIGPPNYYYDPDSLNLDVNTPPLGIFFFSSSSTSNQDDQPLVAVEISSTSGGLNCTSGFATREAVEAAAADTLVNRDKQQRIIPNINFTCDGAITKWIVDGEWNDGGMRNLYPDLQIWRSTGTSMFTKVGNTILWVQGGSDTVTYYEYNLPTPLNFQAGDVLGIFQPDFGRNRLRVYFQSGVGPRSYYETLDNNDIVEPPTDMFTLGTVFQNDLPLVAVEITVATTPTSTTTTTSTSASATTTAAGTTTTAAGTTTTVAGTTTDITPSSSTSVTIARATTITVVTSEDSWPSIEPATLAGSQVTGTLSTPPACETNCSTNQTPDHTSVSSLSTAATIGIAVSGTVILVVVLLLAVTFLLAKINSHSKPAAVELYETPDAFGMKKKEAYEMNTQTQHIATTANEAYGRVGDIPVVENVAYTPAAVSIPSVQNEAYSCVSGAAVNIDTEEQVNVDEDNEDEMYDYVKN